MVGAVIGAAVVYAIFGSSMAASVTLPADGNVTRAFVLETVSSFGPALITGNFEYNWLYWIAPIIGGIIAAGVYKALHKDTDFPSSAAEEDEQIKQG